MPVHNEEKHISSAIESVLGQSYSNFQLIISNNFSTDSSAEIIDRYSKKDSRIVKVSPKQFYSSTAHAEFLLSSILPLYSNKYSINKIKY
jgi:glycosyltransferase involved in cell wall biosynthesis